MKQIGYGGQYIDDLDINAVKKSLKNKLITTEMVINAYT